MTTPSTTVFPNQLFLSDLAHPDTEATLLAPFFFSTPLEIPVRIEESEGATEALPPFCFLFQNEGGNRRVRFPENIEQLSQGFFQRFVLSLALGPPLQLFSRQHRIALITQAENPLSALEDTAPSLPGGELNKLLVSLQPAFTERMNALFSDVKKRGVIRCLRSAQVVSFPTSSEEPRTFPSSEKILALGLSEGRSGFYRKGEATLSQGAANVRILIPLSGAKEPPLCVVEEGGLSTSPPSASLMEECAASRHLRQKNIPFILKMWGVSYHKTKGAAPLRRILSEYCNEGLLFDYIRREQNVLKRMKLGLQLAQALAEMHSQGIVCLNLSPSSILVHSEGDEVSIRLRSLSSFRDLSLPAHRTCSSFDNLPFQPPEILNKLSEQEPVPVTPAIDLWHASNLFFALKNGRFPSEEAFTLFPERAPNRFGYMSMHTYIGHKTNSPRDPVDQAIVDLSSFFPEYRPPAAVLVDLISRWIASHSQ